MEFTIVKIDTLEFLDPFLAKLRRALGNGFSSVHELHLHGPSRYGSSLLFLKCPAGDNPSMSLGLRLKGLSLAPYQLVKAAEKVFDFSPLAILEIIDESELSAETWASVFAPLERLRSVSLKAETSVDAFFEALSATKASGGFSSLSQIALRKINFKKQRVGISDALKNQEPVTALPIVVFIEKARHLGESQRSEIMNNTSGVEFRWDREYSENIKSRDSAAESSDDSDGSYSSGDDSEQSRGDSEDSSTDNSE